MHLQALHPSTQRAGPAPRSNLRILIVDDDEADLRLARRYLSAAYSSAVFDEARSGAEALQKVTSAPYDCLLLDHFLPDANALSLIPRIQAAAPELPFVLFTGQGDEDTAVELMKAGVADYIPKSSFTADRLAIGVRHALAMAEATADRRRAEAELRAQEAMFHAVADTIPQLAWIMNSAGERSWFNRRWLEFTGTTLEEMRGWGWQKVHDPVHLDRAMAGLRRSLESGLPWEETVSLRARDGTYRWFLARAIPVRRGDGTIEAWFGTNTDITERVSAEQALRDSEGRLKRALDIETVGVRFFRLDGTVVHANDAFLRMAGFTKQDLTAGQLRWDERPLQGGPRTVRLIEEFKATGRTTPYEREFIRQDGSRWWALLAATRLNDHEGVEFVVDITALKEAEVDARTSADQAKSAIAAKNRFLATVSHDIRQPLQILVAAHARLKAAVSDERTLNTWLPAAESATSRLVRAADQLAHMSRLESGALNPERKVFSIQVLLSDLAAMAGPRAREKGLELVFQACDAHVRSDPDMLRSILDNLVGNAIKYTNRGSVTISCKLAESTLLIEVADTGVGMPAEKLQEIFHEYVRLDPYLSDGLGLGLTIVSREAELLEHPLQVESTVGVGSRFRVEVPLEVVDCTDAAVVKGVPT